MPSRPPTAAQEVLDRQVADGHLPGYAAAVRWAGVVDVVVGRRRRPPPPDSMPTPRRSAPLAPPSRAASPWAAPRLGTQARTTTGGHVSQPRLDDVEDTTGRQQQLVDEAAARGLTVDGHGVSGVGPA